MLRVQGVVESKEIDLVFIAVIFLRLDPQSGQGNDEATDNEEFHRPCCW